MMGCSCFRFIQNPLLLLIIVVVGYLIPFDDAYNILGIFHLPARSHYIMFDSLMVELARRGHNVTVYNPFPKTTSISNYTEVDISQCVRLPDEFADLEKMMPLRSRSFHPVSFVLNMHPTYEEIADCEPLMKLFHESETVDYDVVFVEMFHTDVFLMFPYKMKKPFIGLMPNTMFPWLTGRTANPDNPSYMAQLTEDFVLPRTFYQKLRNTYVYVSSLVLYDYLSTRRTDRIFRKFFGASAPPIAELVKNTSLLIINAHFSLNRVVPLVPAVIAVGGINVKPAEILPKVSKKNPFNIVSI